ncbi:glycosyl transferase family protein [Sphingomonas sp. RS2018]
MAIAARELTMFAGVGLLVGGIDDLVIDMIHGVRAMRRRWRGEVRRSLADLPAPRRRFAIFVPAWDESAVIGAMLRTTMARLSEADLAVFAGAYPNDTATIAAVERVAAEDGRVRLIVGNRAGPTTKADCLNTLWAALIAEEERGRRFDAIVLHDAEDVVHAGELRLYDDALDRADAVQLPVAPLARPGAHLVGGTYLDEFAESHGKALLVREAVGAGVPLAGVGCAIGRDVIDRIAALRGGRPFDATSLTEDYELGLTIRAVGGRTTVALVDERPGGQPVAVHAYFPSTRDAAVRQKARWMIGIALAGWDRTGWGSSHHPGEWWMRMRDRRAPLAMIVLLAAYGALFLYALALLLTLVWPGRVEPPQGTLALLLAVNGLFLLWRMAMRFAFVAQGYGMAEGLRAMPRMVVGNIVAMMAARRALVRYVTMLRGAPPTWDKTDHEFPIEPERAA